MQINVQTEPERVCVSNQGDGQRMSARTQCVPGRWHVADMLNVSAHRTDGHPSFGLHLVERQSSLVTCWWSDRRELQ